VGLSDRRPHVLFAGSSVFIARSEFEVPFVRRWLEALRRSEHTALRDVPVLVRPHPFNADAWADADFSDLGPVAIWPRQRYTPAEESARSSFFDSLHYSAAIVGLNTSALIEGAILGKPVLSLVTPEFAGTQEGTLHFRYLLPENGGFLRVAHSFEAHQTQLAEALEHPSAIRAQTQQFVRSFLRPDGLDRACTPVLADAFERAARAGTIPQGTSLATRLLRVIVAPLALVVHEMGAQGGTRSKKAVTGAAHPRPEQERKGVKSREPQRWTRVSMAARSLGRVSIRRISKGARSGRRSIVRWTRLARYNIATRVFGRGAPSGDLRP
jgi:hypothetical protein